MLKYKHKLYGRKKGRRLSFSSKLLIKNFLPKIQIKSFSIENDFIKFREKFSQYKFFLEIGFGKGEHILELALKEKNWFFIGVEPYINGVAQLLKEINKNDISNISIFSGDGLVLLENLPENSIDKIAIMFPDPWPKKKHIGRRFINQKSLCEISRVLQPKGEIRLASDHWGTQNWILKNFFLSGKFLWVVEKSENWMHKPKDFPNTRYMEKAIKSKQKPVWFMFINNK